MDVFIAEKPGKRGVRDSPLVFDTRPRPIFAHVQDGAGDSELRVFPLPR